MLSTLSIRDVVLIDRLDLSFPHGLCALTGETGAGKSILLDALGLGLGARADARLVRQGAAQASVSARFDLAADHPAHRHAAPSRTSKAVTMACCCAGWSPPTAARAPSSTTSR